MNNTDSTIKFYNENAAEYIDNTFNADMSEAYNKFLAHIKPNAKILDVGCGSGRDSKYFIDNGYSVTSIDACEEFCKYAGHITGQEVLCMTFDEIDFKSEFDAAWACASLLHVEKNLMSEILKKISESLKPNGVLYLSYKYGDSERIVDGKIYSDYNEKDINSLFNGNTCLQCMEWWISSDVRQGKEKEKWINFIAKKK